jgi:hypothetical protein
MTDIHVRRRKDLAAFPFALLLSALNLPPSSLFPENDEMQLTSYLKFTYFMFSSVLTLNISCGTSASLLIITI